MLASMQIGPHHLASQPEHPSQEVVQPLHNALANLHTAKKYPLKMKGTKVQNPQRSSYTVHTLKPWCLGSYADLAYSSYSDAQASTHIVHPVITNHTEATVSGCMHAYQTSFMQNVSSSYFDAASLTGALLAAFD